MDAYSRTSTRPAGGAARRPARRGGARRPLNFGRAGIRALALAALGIVAGNATLFGVYSPFGLVAVAIAALGLNIAECTSVVAGALAGSALGGGAVGVIAGCVVGDGPDGWKALQEGVAPLGDADGGGDRVAGGLGCGGAGGGGGVSVGAYSPAQAVLSGAAAACCRRWEGWCPMGRRCPGGGGGLCRAYEVHLPVPLGNYIRAVFLCGWRPGGGA